MFPDSLIKTYKQQISSFFQKRKKVPYIQQMKDSDCGPASLAMILNYYGYKVSVTECAKSCESYGVGITTRNIINAAKEYNLDAKLYSLELHHLGQMKYPMIIHWEFNHFVVLERISGDNAIIVDPAFGRRVVSFEEFDKCFTGIAITLTPNNSFVKRKRKGNLKFRQAIKEVFLTSSMAAGMSKIVVTVLLLQALTLSSPLLLQYIIDHIVEMKLVTVIEALNYGVISFAILTFCITYLRACLVIKIQTDVDKNLVEQFIDRLAFLPVSFFLQRASGDIQSRLNSNTVIRDALSSHTISTFLDGLFTIGYAVLLYFISPTFCLLVTLLGIFQIVVYGVMSNPIKDKIASEVKVQASYQSYLVELIRGITTIKSTASEEKVLLKFKSLFRKYLIVARNRSYAESLVNSISISLRVASPIIILLYSTTLYFDGELSLGTLLAINAIANLFLQPLVSLASIIRHLQLARVHAERIGEIWLHETEKEQTFSITEFSDFESLEVRDLYFSYFKNGEPTLKNISFRVTKGSKIAIVGSTGSGKTTLLSILLGFLKPTQGEVRLNNENLQDYDLSVFRKGFGVVPQSAFLFNASIKDNITICNPELSFPDIENAAKLACLDEEISNFPMTYETIVGEGGDMLSGGQKQRLSIARAIANKPSLLFLDEATSNLDSATEKRVSKNIENLDNTQIIVSHRMSTIKNCDQILVLDKGELISAGSHDELVSKCEIYRVMVENQSLS